LLTTLRSRLILVFLLLALIPSIALTFIMSRRLSESIEYWRTPAVETSLESAVNLFRTALREKSDYVGSTVESLRREIGNIPLRASDREWLERRLAATELDLLCLLKRGDGPRARVVFASGPPDLVNQLADSTKYLHESSPATFFLAESCLVVAQSVPERPGAFLLGGMIVGKNLLAGGSDVRSALKHYRQLDIYQLVNRQMVWIVFSAMAILVVFASSILAGSLASSVTRPVRALETGMRRVAQGDLDHQVEAKGTDEVNFLVESFNNMTSELRVAKERLRRAERVAAWREIARKAAHEIRNPLQPMRLAIARLKQSLSQAGDSGKLEAGSALDSIAQQIESLTNLAAQFSELGKLPDPALSRLDLGQVLRGIAPLYESERFRVDLEIEKALPEVMADKDQISRALVNLISNAVDAMGEKGTVKVRAARERLDGKLWVRLSVRDDGKGIPPDKLEKIFDPYFTTKETGTGLGLSIVSKIVSDHRGNLTVTSEEGKGSEFSLWLPPAEEAEEAGGPREES